MVYAWLSQQLLPERCPACAQPSAAGFCEQCRAAHPTLPDACPRCALPRPVKQCPRRTAEWHIETVLAPFDYRAPLDHYVVAMKFHGARKLGRALGLLLGEAVQRAGAEADIDALVPVPLHRSRLLERGYNQAFEIARTAARELRVPLMVRGIIRAKATVPQSGANAQARRGNVREAFTVSRELEGLRLAVVDDVITTGATLSALARVLHGAGAARIDGWAVARTVGWEQGGSGFSRDSFNQSPRKNRG